MNFSIRIQNVEKNDSLSFTEMKSESPDSTATSSALIERSCSTTATSEDEGLGSERLMLLRCRRRRKPTTGNCDLNSSASCKATDSDDLKSEDQQIEQRLQQLQFINRKFLTKLERREQLLTTKESLVRSWSLQDTLEQRRLAVLDGQLHSIALQLVALDERSRRLQQSEAIELQNWQNLWQKNVNASQTNGNSTLIRIEDGLDRKSESNVLKQLFTNECNRIDRLREERKQLQSEHNRLILLQSQLLQQRNDQAKTLTQVSFILFFVFFYLV